MRHSRLGAWRRPVRGYCTAPPHGPYDVLFCGTDAFALEALKQLAVRKDAVRSLQVLTPPSVKHAWGGRRMRVAPVRQYACEAAVPTYEVPADGMDAFMLPDAVRDSAAPMLITVSFGHRIPQALLAQFPSASTTLNLHPSLLPALRGAAPVQWALARKHAYTGVSVQQLHPTHFDKGRLLAQETVAIPDASTYETLLPTLATHGARLLVDTVANLPARHATAQEQDDTLATRAPKLTQRFAEVHWAKWGADTIDARLRGFGHQVPLTTTLIPRASTSFPSVQCMIRQGGNLRRLYGTPLATLDARAHAALFGADGAPGMAVYSPALHAVVVRCASDDDVMLLLQLQTKGKPIRSAEEWWRGFHDRADAGGRIQWGPSGG